jgi:hemolysin III
LIAGTYTPFLLISLRGSWGWSLFGIIWGITVLGIALKILFIYKFQKIFLGLYIVMGWLVIIASREVLANVETTGIILIIAGGVSYMLGVPFYVWKKLPYNHAIWHIFVLAGSIFHYFAVLTIL